MPGPSHGQRVRNPGVAQTPGMSNRALSGGELAPNDLTGNKGLRVLVLFDVPGPCPKMGVGTGALDPRTSTGFDPSQISNLPGPLL